MEERGEGGEQRADVLGTGGRSHWCGAVRVRGAVPAGERDLQLQVGTNLPSKVGWVDVRCLK